MRNRKHLDASSSVFNACACSRPQWCGALRPARMAPARRGCLPGMPAPGARAPGESVLGSQFSSSFTMLVDASISGFLHSLLTSLGWGDSRGFNSGNARCDWCDTIVCRYAIHMHNPLRAHPGRPHAVDRCSFWSSCDPGSREHTESNCLRVELSRAGNLQAALPSVALATLQSRFEKTSHLLLHPASLRECALIGCPRRQCSRAA